MSISAQLFTTEDISSLPVPVIKFKGDKSDKNIINNPELMGYHQNCLRNLLSKLIHHLQKCLTCH